MLLALRLLLGAAEGPLFLLKTTYIREAFTLGKTGKPNAISSMGVSLGTAVGLPLVTFLVYSSGWVSSYLVLAGLNALVERMVMMRVSVLGCGAIGGTVARALRDGRVTGAELVGVSHRDAVDPPDLPVIDVSTMIGSADLVVECAGHAALAETGPKLVAAGVDLLVASVGALTDAALLAALSAGPGRVRLTTGAIGGLDLLRSAATMGGLDWVRITTTKLPTVLAQPWMDQAEVARLRATTTPLVLRRGSAREIATAFPRSANVAASVALAVGDWHLVEAAVVADPRATRTRHVIEAEGAAGRYRFDIDNVPSTETPTTSAVVPYALLRAITDLASTAPTFR